MRRAVGFGADLAGLVNDRPGAVAGIFNDFALLDEDQSWAVIMAVPWNYAAGLNHELAESQLTVGDLCLLFAEIDRAERSVGHADGLKVDGLARIRHALVGRTFASLRAECKARRSDEGCGSDGAEQAFADRSVHPYLLSVSPRPRYEQPLWLQ